jgi:hypothetical protein
MEQPEDASARCRLMRAGRYFVLPRGPLTIKIEGGALSPVQDLSCTISASDVHFLIACAHFRVNIFLLQCPISVHWLFRGVQPSGH